ncbi:alcohol dehydrogenase 1 [Tanacetum coccineum]
MGMFDINDFYASLRPLWVRPQKELSVVISYWLLTNEIASQASNSATPVMTLASREDDTIRNLDAQINIMKVLNVGSTEGSCDQQALDTDRIQLKDTITSLRIQLDGLKVENNQNLHESRKPMPKSHTRNHHILPSKSVNARRAADHNRKLNVVDLISLLIRSLRSLSKGRTVVDSIAERLTRPTAYKFKTDCSIIPVWVFYSDLKDMLEERGCCTTGLYSYEGYHGPGLSGLSPLVKWDLHKCCSIHTVIIDPHGIRANDDSKYPMQDHALILLKYLKEIEIKKIEEDTSSKLFQIPTDMSMWRLKISPLFPRIPGHEGVGVIESVGKDAKGLKPGDIVMPLYLGECGQCLNCKTGKTNLCHVYLPPFSGLMNDGTSRMTIARTGESIYHFTSCSTWTKYAVADCNYVLKIDPKISYPHASFLPCGFTTGFGATWRETQLSKGSLVSVFGIGTVGLGGIGTVVPIGAGGEASVAINSLILFSSRTLKCTTFGGIRTQSDLPVIINKCLNK